MHKIDIHDVPSQTDFDGAESVEMRKLLGENQGAENFHLRVFRVKKGGHTPYHNHPYEHEVFILSGNGRVRLSDGFVEFSEEDAIFIQPNEMHQFIADTELRFICVVPTEKHFDKRA